MQHMDATWTILRAKARNLAGGHYWTMAFRQLLKAGIASTHFELDICSFRGEHNRGLQQYSLSQVHTSSIPIMPHLAADHLCQARTTEASTSYLNINQFNRTHFWTADREIAVDLSKADLPM